MKLNDVKSVFFIGIGGIGMSALARYLNEKGIKVTGYDKTETALTKKLAEENIDIHYKEDVELIPDRVDLAIWTPAIPQEHKQLVFLRKQGIPLIKRAELLGLIANEMRSIAVAGTHGKTTTSTMIAYLADQLGLKISAFLGGISTDFGTNLVIGKSDWVVVEADEFDRSFLHLTPEVSVINSMDADHLDIYGDEESLVSAFNLFVLNTKNEGKVVINERIVDRLTNATRKELDDRKVKIITFGETGDARYKNVMLKDGVFHFDYEYGEIKLKNIALALPGFHNLENIVASLTTLSLAGVDMTDVKNRIQSFRGIKRRFERIFDSAGSVFFDDYAHHPTEIEVTVKSLKAMYPDKKILGVFQPHLFSRTKDFYFGFGNTLDMLDEVILLPIYPARELPIEGVSSGMIMEVMKNRNVVIVRYSDLLEELKTKDFDVLVTLGAGDIDRWVPKIKEWLING